MDTETRDKKSAHKHGSELRPVRIRKSGLGTGVPETLTSGDKSRSEKGGKREKSKAEVTRLLTGQVGVTNRHCARRGEREREEGENRL